MKRNISLIMACLVAALCLLQITTPRNISAASVTAHPWPSGLALDAYLLAHGDSSVTAATTADCNTVSVNDMTPSTVTQTPDFVTSYITHKSTTDNWLALDCDRQTTVSSDGTLYYVMRHTVSPVTFKVVAMRNGVELWEQSHIWFPKCSSNDPTGGITNLTLGYDGNIYAEASGCSGTNTTRDLISLDAGTGALRFATSLASNSSIDILLPYKNGVAVANNGPTIYFFNLSGSLQPADTFTPDPTGLSQLYTATVSPDGKAYMEVTTVVNGTSQYHFYERSLGLSTINEIILPTSARFTVSALSPTPSGGIAFNAKKLDHGSTPYLVYLDANDTEVYEKNLLTDAHGNAVGAINLAVDNLGNVVTVRTVQMNNGQDHQNVYIDSFDASGNMTRIFDSYAQFGLSSSDDFSTSYWTGQAIGSGRIYLTLCHQTYGYALTCTNTENPQIIEISTASSFDYTHSQLFSTATSQPNYVALGDSYSSGEGNAPFSEPSSTDGCHRSPQAYAVGMAQTKGYNLRAFVACSGATSDEVYTGMNGEPGQLGSLGLDTDIVTLTSGGNDVGFGNFAAACITSDCSVGSSAYTTIMDKIDTYLQDNLELLYSHIHTASPRAAVYVLGYPYVTPPFGTLCDSAIGLSDSEEQAARDVADRLNIAIEAAVQTAGPSFHFVNPNSGLELFGGHEICTSDPYFFGLNITNRAYSFHPNAEGQAAYAQTLEYAIQ